MTKAAKLSLDLYLSPEHACAYLPERLARLAFIDPDAVMDARTYGGLAAKGFRRSGAHVYRPYCAGCQACIPLRVPVVDFSPDRGQRRVVTRNRDLRLRTLPASGCSAARAAPGIASAGLARRRGAADAQTVPGSPTARTPSAADGG